jgi:hypothetical protein
LRTQVSQLARHLHHLSRPVRRKTRPTWPPAARSSTGCLQSSLAVKGHWGN